MELRLQNAKENLFCMNPSSEVLRGVVALVEVRSEHFARSLRAQLADLGATVVPRWNLFITHLVWGQGGCRWMRREARSDGVQLVSPLWVERCAAADRRLPEEDFPAPPRPSDLPSPLAMRTFLQNADRGHIGLENLSSGSDAEDMKLERLRLSESLNSLSVTDKSADSSLAVEGGVNTAPRIAHPLSLTPQPVVKKKRKLFTQKIVFTPPSEEDRESPKRVRSPRLLNPPRGEECLQTLEGLLRASPRRSPQASPRRSPRASPRRSPRATQPSKDDRLRIVLTGMAGKEKSAVLQACRTFNAVVQREVNEKTTHVLLGSCGLPQAENNNDIAGASAGAVEEPLRTVNALLGAARGCRVLRAQWALDSLEAGQWLPHPGYEAPHLTKLAERARIERNAYDLMGREYGYYVFFSTRVRVSLSAEHSAEVVKLLILCGATVYDHRGILVHDSGGDENAEDKDKERTKFDVTLGAAPGEVGSRWVFDSVAATRMRNIRPYIN